MEKTRTVTEAKSRVMTVRAMRTVTMVTTSTMMTAMAMMMVKIVATQGVSQQATRQATGIQTEMVNPVPEVSKNTYWNRIGHSFPSSNSWRN